MEGNAAGSSTVIPIMALDFGQIGNSYLEEKPEIHFRSHQFGTLEQGGYQPEEMITTPSRHKRTGGRRSGNTSMDSSIININPTGIITYMSVQEARAQGLIETLETEESQEGFSYAPEGQELGSWNDDDCFELDPEQFLSNMCFNPIASNGPSQYKTITKTPATRGRTFIPIRKSSVGMGKSTPTITVRSQNYTLLTYCKKMASSKCLNLCLTLYKPAAKFEFAFSNGDSISACFRLCALNGSSQA